MTEACLNNLSNVEPIFYQVRNIIFRAIWKDSIPCIVKIGRVGGITPGINESTIAKFISDNLYKTCPNIILTYCSATEKINHYSIYEFLHKNRKWFYDKKKITNAELIRKDLILEYKNPNLNSAQKQEIKKNYDEQEKIIRQGNYYQKYTSIMHSQSSEIIVYERVFSSLTMSYFLNTVKLTKSNFYSLSFQLLYFIYSLHKIGISHLDIGSRNIWLQKIKSEYKYILYPRNTGVGDATTSYYYVPLADSFHYILKVGDYGESRPELKNHCEDLIQVGSLLTDLHKNCKDCTSLLIETVECLKSCTSTCLEFALQNTFADLYVFQPDVDPKSLITPDLYFDINIIDLNSM